MGERTIILSDTHLGRKHCAVRHARSLRPLWLGFDHLIINGDVAEVHHPRHRAAASREVLDLQDLCTCDGIRLSLLSGNHDAYLTDLRHCFLAEGQVLVMHGDALHPAVAPWSPAAHFVRLAHTEALERLDIAQRSTLQHRLAAIQHAAHVEWTRIHDLAASSSIRAMLLRPWAILQVLHYWHIAPRLAAEFMHDFAPGARFIILGHTHRPGIWHIDDRTIINTGSFGFPGSPRAAIIDNHSLSIHRIINRRGEYRIVSRATARFDLNAPQATGTKTNHNTSEYALRAQRPAA